jgi:isoleucyl-tRNA synthetase
LLAPLLETYRKIRNTCRFLLGNLSDFDPLRHAVPAAAMPELDRWVLHRVQRLLATTLDAYEAFAFHHVVQGLVNFCAVDLSALYLDIVKDRLYCSAAESPERRAAQTAVWRTLDVLVRVMAPILSYTADDVWAHLPGRPAATVFEAGLPVVDAALLDEALARKWDRLLDVRAAVTKALEQARQSGLIGHSLDARVRLAGTDGLGPLLDGARATLPALFIVSQVEVAPDLDHTHVSPLLRELRVAVERARGAKCERCWNYSEAVGQDAEHPGLCDRCLAVVRSSPVLQAES